VALQKIKDISKEFISAKKRSKKAKKKNNQ
jgi:hypothetical protein